MTNLIPCKKLTLEKQMGIVEGYVNDLLSAAYKNEEDKHGFLEKFFGKISNDTFNEYNKIIKEKYKGNVGDFLSDYFVYRDNFIGARHRIYDDYIVGASLLLSDEVGKIDTDMLNHIINGMLGNFPKYVGDYYNTEEIKSLYDVYNKIYLLCNKSEEVESNAGKTTSQLYHKAVFFSLIGSYLAGAGRKGDEVVNFTYYEEFVKKYNNFIINSYLSDGKIKKFIKNINTKLANHPNKEKIIGSVEEDMRKLKEKLSEDSENIRLDNLLINEGYATNRVLELLTKSIYNTNILIDTILTGSIIKANKGNIPKTVEALVRIGTEGVTDKTIQKIVNTVTNVYDKMGIKKIDTGILKGLADIKKMEEIEKRKNIKYLYKGLRPKRILGFYISGSGLIFSNYFTRVYTGQFLNYGLSTTLHEFTHLLNKFYLSSYIEKLVGDVKYDIDKLVSNLVKASSIEEKKGILKNMKEYYKNVSVIVTKLFSDLSLTKNEKEYVVKKLDYYISKGRGHLIDELIAFIIGKKVGYTIWKDEKLINKIYGIVDSLLSLFKDTQYNELKSTIDYSIRKIDEVLNSSEEEIDKFINKAKINDIYVRYMMGEEKDVKFIDEDNHFRVIDTILNDSGMSLKKLITDGYNIDKDNVIPKKIIFINDIIPEKNTVLSSQTKAGLMYTINLGNIKKHKTRKLDMGIGYRVLDRYYLKDGEKFIEIGGSDLKQVSDGVYAYINDPETVIVKLPDDVFEMYNDGVNLYGIINENYLNDVLGGKSQVGDLIEHIPIDEIIEDMYERDVKKILPRAIEYVDDVGNKQYKKYLTMLNKLSGNYINTFYDLGFHFNLYLTQYGTIALKTGYISTDGALNTLAKMVAFGKGRMMKFVINDEKLSSVLKKDIDQSLNLEKIVGSYLNYKNSKSGIKFKKAFDLYVQGIIRKTFPFKIDNGDIKQILFAEVKKDLINAYNEIKDLEKTYDKINVYLNRLPYLISATEDIGEFFSVKMLHDVMVRVHEGYKKIGKIEPGKQSYRETFKNIINNLTPKQQEYLDFLDNPDRFIKEFKKKIGGVKSIKTSSSKALQEKSEKVIREMENFKKRLNYKHVAEVFDEIDKLLSQEYDTEEDIYSFIEKKTGGSYEADDFFSRSNSPESVYSYIKSRADKFYSDRRKNAGYKKYADYLNIVEKTLNRLGINFYDEEGKIIPSYFVLPKEDYIEKVENFIKSKTAPTEEKMVKAERKISDIVGQGLYSGFITRRLVEYFKEYQIGIDARNLKNIANGIVNGKYKISGITETAKIFQEYFTKRVTGEITSLDIQQYNALRAGDYKGVLGAIINIAHVNYEKFEQEARKRYEMLKKVSDEPIDEFVENATIVGGRIGKYEDVKDLLKLAIAAEEFERIINNFSEDVTHLQPADIVYENLKTLKEIHDGVRTNRLKSTTDNTHLSLITSSFSTTYYVPTTQGLSYNVIKLMTEKGVNNELLRSIKNLISSYKTVKPYELYEEVPYDELISKYIFQNEGKIKLNKRSVEKVGTLSKGHLDDAEGTIENLKNMLERKSKALKDIKVGVKYSINNDIMTSIALLRDINNFINSYTAILNTISKNTKTSKLVNIKNKINDLIKMEKRLVSDDNIGKTISQVESILKEIKKDIPGAKSEIDKILKNKNEINIDLFGIFSDKVEKNIPTNNKIIEVPVVEPVEYRYYKKVGNKYEEHTATINEVKILKFNEQDLYLGAYEINLRGRLYRFLKDKEKDLDEIFTEYIEADDKIKYIEKEFETFNGITTDFIKKALDFIIDKESFRDDTYAFISVVNDIEKSAEPISKIGYEKELEELQEKGILDKFGGYSTKINEATTQIDTTENLSRGGGNIKKPTVEEIYHELKDYYNITKEDVEHNYEIRLGVYNNKKSIPVHKGIDIVKNPNVIKWDSDGLAKYELNNIFIGNKKISGQGNTHLVILNSEDINGQAFSIPINILSSNEGLLKDIDIEALTINVNKYIKELAYLPSDERNKFVKELKKVHYWLDKIKNEGYDVHMKKNIDVFNTNYHANLILSIYLAKLLESSNSLDEFKNLFKSLYIDIYDATNFGGIYKKLGEALEKLEKTEYYEKALGDDEMKKILKNVKIIDDYKQEVAGKIVEDLLGEHSEFDKYLEDVFNTFKDVYDLGKKIGNEEKEGYGYLAKVKKYTSNIKAKNVNKKLTEIEEKYTNLAKNFVEGIGLQEKIQSMRESFLNTIFEQDQKYLNEVLDEVQNKKILMEKIENINNKLNKLGWVRGDYYLNERLGKEIPSYKPIVEEKSMEYYLNKVRDELKNFDEGVSNSPCTLND